MTYTESVLCHAVEAPCPLATLSGLSPAPMPGGPKIALRTREAVDSLRARGMVTTAPVLRDGTATFDTQVIPTERGRRAAEAIRAAERAPELMPARPHTAPPLDRRPEKTVQADIVRFLHALGCHVSDLSQPRATMQTEGIPDLFVMAVGGAFWCEVKTRRGRVSAAQQAWHDRARAAGQTVIVARSAADLVDPLRALGAPLAAL